MICTALLCEAWCVGLPDGRVEERTALLAPLHVTVLLPASLHRN
jgi:hypothetical protein